MEAPNRSSTTAGVDKARFDSILPGKSPHDDLNSGAPSLEFLLQISRLVEFERGEQPDDLFFGRLESPSQAVMGRALDESLRHKMAIRPCFGKDVHILLLQAGGQYEILLPAKNPG